MTLAAPASAAVRHSGGDAAAAGRFISPLAGIICAAVAFSLVREASGLREVWTTGVFNDSDDAMRMVQVRDLMAGQGWFDMVVHRLDPPQGLLSHWSRIVDVPIVALVRFFGLFLGDVAAERAARIAFPTLLLAGLYAACAYAARLLAGPRFAAAGVIAAACCGVAAWQFCPGRIDHHAPQILLLVCGLATLAHSLDAAHARRAAWAGLAIALSLGISIENLAFIVVMAATPFVAFIVQGARARAQLTHFALGLGVGMPAVFLTTIPAARWLDPARDAFSIIHLTAGLAGAVACLALARLCFERLSSRLAAAGGAGAAALALVLFLFPNALHDPLEGLDPILRSFWADHLQETEPFFTHLRRDPLDGACWLVPLLFGLGGALLGAAHSQSVARGRWLLLATAIAAGALTACWQIRVISSTAPLMALGSLGLVAALAGRLEKSNPAFGGPLSVLVMVVATSRLGLALALALVLDPLAPAPASSTGVPASATTFAAPSEKCDAPAAFAPLAALPAGLALAPIDLGPDLLAHTRHAIVAAPYHRNNVGNLLALNVFTASPDEAGGIARASGAHWIFLCLADDSSLAAFTRRAPDGLAAHLAKNEIPGWLTPVPLRDTPYRAFEVLAK